jgi:putative tricarboxylic transport membrane protein
MLKKINNDQWSSAFWLACGIAICFTSLHYGLGTLHAPETGFVPFIAGLAISLLALIGFAGSTVRQREGIEWKPLMPEGAKGGRLLLTIGSLFAYALFLTPLGFTLCTAIFVSLLLRLGKTYRWPAAIAGGVVTALSTYGVFGALLNVQFPKGPWGF